MHLTDARTSPLALHDYSSLDTDFDVLRAREETPGCEMVLHLNNAGAALVPTPVLQAQLHHLEREAHAGAYEAAEFAHDQIERVYASAAKLLNCGGDELAVVDSSTRAWQLAFHAIPLRRGDRILTGVSEYASNYISFLRAAERSGARIEVIGNDEFGQMSVEALRRRIDERTRIIAVTHVPTDDGLINPIEEIGEIARQAGAIFLVDACQSVGQLPIDVRAVGCDVLAAAGRKYLRGPRGTALLYVKRSLLPLLEPTFLDLTAVDWRSRDEYSIRTDARQFENWESSYVARIGLGVAIDYALQWGIDKTWQRIAALATELRQRLQSLPGVMVRDGGPRRCGLVTFTVRDLPAKLVRQTLAAKAINVSDWCVEYARLGMDARALSSVVRASVHYYNTVEEVDRFCSAVGMLAHAPMKSVGVGA